jgi:hypothetical protein
VAENRSWKEGETTGACRVGRQGEQFTQTAGVESPVPENPVGRESAGLEEGLM